MSEYTFRRAQIENDAEIKFIAEIDNTIPALLDSDFVVNEKMNQDRMKFLKSCQEEDFFDVVLDSHHNIVAFHVVKKVPYFDRFAGRIDTLWVSPNHRKKRLAFTLKQRAEKWALELNLDHLHTWVHSDNKKMKLLNEQMGYRIVNYKMRKDKKAFSSDLTSNPSEKIAQPRLETKRLILEPYKDSDLQDIFDYGSNPEITQFVPWSPHKTREDSQKFLNFVYSSTCHVPGKLFFVFAIRLKETGKVIGSIDFKNPQPWIGQIDYALSVDHWNKGIMTEAAQAIKTWALEACPKMVRLQAGCLPENKGSSRVMEKIGMTFEGIRKKSHHWGNGEYKNLAFYAWVRPE